MPEVHAEPPPSQAEAPLPFDADGTGRLLYTAPLMPVAIGMIAGMATDARWALPLWLFAGGLVLASIAVFCVRREGFAVIAVVMAGWCAGGILHALDARIAHPDSIGRYAGEARRLAGVRGTVVSPPRLLEPPVFTFSRWTFGRERTAFLLDVDGIRTPDGWRPARDRLRVTVQEAVPDLVTGERVEIFGWLSALRPRHNPGTFDWAAHQRRNGVVAALRTNHREAIRRIGFEPSDGGPVGSLRRTARDLLIDSTLPDEEQSGLLDAMILGQRSRVAEHIDEAFIRAGCVHFLAVSGFHVGVWLGAVWFVGRRLFLSQRACALLMLAAALLYAGVAEPRPPILRATIIAVFFCGALLIGRGRAGLNWLSAAAIMLIVLRPSTVFDVGFQLSFTAVVGIMFLPNAMARMSAGARRRFERTVLGYHYGDEDRALRISAARRHRGWPYYRWWLLAQGRRWILLPFLVSLAAWLACLPIVATHFERLHGWAPVNALLTIPLVVPLIVLGFGKLLVGPVVPAWGAAMAVPIGWLDSGLSRWVARLADLPGAAVELPPVPGWWTAAWYAALAAFCWRFAATTDMPVLIASIRADRAESHETAVSSGHPGAGILCALTLCVLAGTTYRWAVPPGADGRLTLTVLSVGSGSATVMELPEGQVMVYDAGTMGAWDVGAHVVVPFLRHRRIHRIDRIHVSHPNLDHLSGVPSIIEQVDCGPVVVNGYFRSRAGPRSPARHLLDWLEERGHPIHTMTTDETQWTFGGATFELLWPIGPPDDSLSSNETSTVLRVSYRGYSILLPGDVEDRAQYALAHRGDVEADVLILPHHGGYGRALPEFVDAVDPAILIRSSGEPMAETYTDLALLVGDRRLLNTADDGAVTVTLDRTGVHVSSAL